MIIIARAKHYSEINVGFIGMGYVGLVGCGVMGNHHRTYYYDIDQTKMRKLANKEMYIQEPNLEELYNKDSDYKNPQPMDSIKDIVERCKVIFVTVGTPSNKDGSVNIDYVMNVAEEIGKTFAHFDTKSYSNTRHIILKSTVPPTVTKQFAMKIKELGGNGSYEVLYSPEFLAEGSAVSDIENPDKIVMGSYHEYNQGVCTYDPLHKTVRNMFEKIYGEKTFRSILTYTSWENAEMIKYANNSFLATKITFINTIADICENIKGADVNVVAKALGKDMRINPSFLRAGLGYGGSCFTKDIWGISKFSEDFGDSLPLLRMVNILNAKRRSIPREIGESIWDVTGDFTGKRVAILGLTFKPGTEDMRDSPALDIIDSLVRRGALIQCYDPQANEKEFNARYVAEPNVHRVKSAKFALKRADMAVLVTDWEEFDILEADDFLLLMNDPVLVDGRRIIKDPETLISNGVKYYGIGYGNNAINRAKISRTC